MPLFSRVTIVGLGLIGGSLGLAIRRHRLSREVVGLSRKASTIVQAKRRGAIDWGTTDAELAVREADLVILASPVETIVPLAKRLAPSMKQGSILTDVGSTKAKIVAELDRALPSHVRFVGGHPLAGSEERGIKAASARLFDGSRCILTPTARTHSAALRKVGALWRALKVDVVTVNPKQHDRLLAQTSHLAHLVAFGLIAAADREALAIAPRSFLDATRVAKSDPDLWDDILLSNQKALLVAMDRFEKYWRKVRQLLVRSDHQALRRFLADAYTKRHACEES